ncbi:MAG: hypothetical protein ACYCPT_02410, partial [Acidimicrobiales bacterium]
MIDPRFVYVAMVLAALGGGIYVRDTCRHPQAAGHYDGRPSFPGYIVVRNFVLSLVLVVTLGPQHRGERSGTSRAVGL